MYDRPIRQNKNEDIRKELEIAPINDKILERRQQWHGHMLRMEDGRYPNAVLNYKPKGRRDRGRPRKRWRDL